MKGPERHDNNRVDWVEKPHTNIKRSAKCAFILHFTSTDQRDIPMTMTDWPDTSGPYPDSDKTYHNKHTNVPPHDKTSNMTCAPSEDSDQPGHPPSLIRVFAVRMKKAWVLTYP